MGTRRKEWEQVRTDANRISQTILLREGHRTVRSRHEILKEEGGKEGRKEGRK
jgi:hypothetical protein